VAWEKHYRVFSMVLPSHLLKESAAAPATYRLVVRSAEEAVRTIQSQWGGQARVVSVRQVPGQGFAGLFGRPRLEVIAQVGAALGEEGEPSPAWSRTLQDAEAEMGEPRDERHADGDVVNLKGREESVAAALESEPVDARPSLVDLLRRAGFSESLRSRLQLEPGWERVRSAPLHRQVAVVGKALCDLAAARGLRPVTGRVAFLGSAGSGKTTALAKWITRQIAVGGAVGRVVEVDGSRPVPAILHDAASSAGLKVETLASAGVASAGGSVSGPVAMECVALSVTDGEARRSQRRMLDRDEISTRILVLNALYDVGTLQRIAGAGRELGATHVVFTHLDELTQWGRLWELLVEGELSPLFLSTGPSAVGSREDDVVAAVLRRTVPGAGGA
jgi:flagellar biosynthesis protein FlhF